MSALKIVISALCVVGSLFFATSPALAVDLQDINPQNWNADKQSAFTINTLPFAGVCLLAQVQGCPVTVLDPNTNETSTKLVKNGVGGGAVLALANLTSTFYQVPPTSSVEYLASLSEQFGLGKPALAQSVGGSGEGIIKPVKNLWMVSQKISYLAFILIFMVVGLMIMFRQKLNPQTVITAQAALPGLIVSLILVFLSYFIAAFMVDTAFLSTKVVGYLFSANSVQLKDPNTGKFVENKLGKPEEMANDSNMFGIFTSAMGTSFGATGELVNGLLPGGMPAVGVTGVIGGVIAALLGPIGWAVGGVLAAPAILTTLLGLILLIALIVQMFKLFFALLNSYIQILVFTIAGPLMITFGAIPGRGGIVSFWIRGILANALVFPAVFAALMFAGAILSNTNPNDWQVSPPLFAGLKAEVLRVILAYGIILGTPSIPGIVREVFKVKGPQAFAQAAMAGAMAGYGVGKAGYGAGTAGFKQQAGAYYKQEAASRAGAGPAPTTYKPWYRLFGRGQ